MSACSQCGTVAKSTDKFCNVCGTPLAQQGAPAPPHAAPAYGAQQGYAAPGPAAGGYASPQQAYAPPPMPAARCQMGHDIPPGASYCPQGHPIALDQMQFAGSGYGAGGGPGYGQQPTGPAYAPTPAPAQAYAAPPQPGFSGPPGPPVPPAQAGYAQPPYGRVPAPGFAAPAAAPYPGAPPMAAPPAAFAQEAAREAAPARILRGFLVAYGTNAAGDFWPLTGGRHIVGRLGSGDGVDVALQDPTISSRHGAIVVDANACTIVVEDTGSTNGTFVNDEHIGFNGRRELRDGDRVRFGGYTTIVKLIGRV